MSHLKEFFIRRLNEDDGDEAIFKYGAKEALEALQKDIVEIENRTTASPATTGWTNATENWLRGKKSTIRDIKQLIKEAQA